jgi:hypothetical protein
VLAAVDDDRGTVDVVVRIDVVDGHERRHLDVRWRPCSRWTCT